MSEYFCLCIWNRLLSDDDTVKFSISSIYPRIGLLAVLMSSSIRQHKRSRGNTFDLLAKLAMPAPYPSGFPTLPNSTSVRH